MIRLHSRLATREISDCGIFARSNIKLTMADETRSNRVRNWLLFSCKDGSCSVGESNSVAGYGSNRRHCGAISSYLRRCICGGIGYSSICCSVNYSFCSSGFDCSICDSGFDSGLDSGIDCSLFSSSLNCSLLDYGVSYRLFDRGVSDCLLDCSIGA